MNSHAESISHRKAVPSKLQALLKVLPSEEVSHSDRALPDDLSDKMQALKPEIINVLYKVHYNYSFSSASGDGKRYPLLVPSLLDIALLENLCITFTR